MACAAHASEARYRLRIPAQPLGDALKELALQTGLQVARLADDGAGDAIAEALDGTYTASDAIRILIRSTPYTYRFVDSRTIAVVMRPPAVPSAQARRRARSNDEPGPDVNRDAPGRARRGDAASGSFERSSEGEGPMSEVVVTGSRILQRADIPTATPVTVVTSAELESLSSGGLVDAMSLLPQFLLNSTPSNAYSFATNAGQSFLNLRGIGPNRTLVLLDGRRVVPSSRLGSTDIGVFPAALISRVEVVTGGASAAYGSDAVGGVANFILDTELEGSRASVRGGATSRGDNENLNISLASGRAIGERLHAVGSLEYVQGAPVETYRGRDWFQGWGRVTNPEWVATRQGPQVLTLPHVTSTRYTFGGLINQPGSALDRLVFEPDGTVRPFPLGPVAAVGGGTWSQSGGGGDNYEADRTGDGSLAAGERRGSAFAHVSYDISDDSQAYVQLLYGLNRIDFVNVGGVQFGQWQATVFEDNAYLPEDVRSIMRAEGLQSFGLSRMASSADLGRARDIVENRTYSLTTGLHALRGDWRISGYYQFGRNRGDTTLEDFVRSDRVFQAMDAVRNPASGAIVCRSTLFDPGNGCVPINLLGAGRASQEAIDYVLDNKLGRVTVDQHFAEVSVDGQLGVGLGAGPVQVALGASFREDRFSQYANPADGSVTAPANDPARGIQGVPDIVAGALIHQFSSFPSLQGAYTVKEGFAEALVPLYSQPDGVRSATLNLTARFARYSGSGGIWAWKAGLEGQVMPGVRLRGTVSRDTRAANLSERFDLQDRGIIARDPVFGNTNYSFSATSEGNPEVDPERADTVTAGVVLQPPGLEGLAVTLDGYSIRIRDAIGQLGPQRIIDDCFAGAASLCELITRSPVGNEILYVQNRFLNIAQAKVSGLDFEGRLTRNVNLFGGRDESVTFRMLASWLAENSITNPGAPKVDRAGQTGGGGPGNVAFPDLRVTSMLSYRNGPFEAYLQGSYIDAGTLDATFTEGVDIDDNSVPSVFYTDVMLSWSLPMGQGGSWSLFGHVENLFDRDPPRAADYSEFNGATHTNESLYDVLGRRFSVGVRATW